MCSAIGLFLLLYNIPLYEYTFTYCFTMGGHLDSFALELLLKIAVNVVCTCPVASSFLLCGQGHRFCQLLLLLCRTED